LGGGKPAEHREVLALSVGQAGLPGEIEALRGLRGDAERADEQAIRTYVSSAYVSLSTAPDARASPITR